MVNFAMSTSPELIFILAVIGLAFGSFLNVCAYRIPRGVSVISVASSCPHCGRRLGWAELVPLISFAVLRGKCATCGKPISWRYPVYELFAGAATVLFFLKYGPVPEYLLVVSFIMVMSVVAVTDWDRLIIPNRVLIVGAVIGLGLNAALFVDVFVERLIASLVSGGIALLVMVAGNWLFKKESMGIGDMKLAALIGLFLDIELFLVSFWLAALLGVMCGAAGVRSNRAVGILDGATQTPLASSLRPDSGLHSGVLLPFGSFLAAASSVVIAFKGFFLGLIDQWLTLMQ